MKRFHSISGIFPLLEGTEFDRFKTDIEENGLIEPIWLHPNGEIIDGRNRYRACLETGIEPRFRTWDGKGSLVGFVVSMNLHRRHLTSGQRAVCSLEAAEMLAEEIAKQEQERKQRQNDPTYQIIDKSDSRDALGEAARLFNTNRQYVSDAKKLQQEAPDLIVEVKAGSITIPQAKRELKKRQRTEMREKEAARSTLDSCNILVGDLRVLGPDVDSNSVDLIFTDPPYGKEHVADYEELAKFGARVLKPNGSLLCYAGQSTLPDALAVMTPHLTYWWTISMKHGGPTQRFPGKWVWIGWKPILWFVKGGRREQSFIADFIESKPSKSHHEWEQGIEEALYYIEHLTVPNELVLDPFCGSGTTCIAARRLGRRYLAFEIDPKTASIAKGRIEREKMR